MRSIRFNLCATFVNLCCLLVLVITSVNSSDSLEDYNVKCEVSDVCKKELLKPAEENLCGDLKNHLTKTVECLPQNFAKELNLTNEHIASISRSLDSTEKNIIVISDQLNEQKNEFGKMAESFKTEMKEVMSELKNEFKKIADHLWKEIKKEISELITDINKNDQELKKEIKKTKNDITETKQLTQEEIMHLLRAEIKTHTDETKDHQGLTNSKPEITLAIAELKDLVHENKKLIKEVAQTLDNRIPRLAVVENVETKIWKENPPTEPVSEKLILSSSKRNCKQWLQHGSKSSKIYEIHPQEYRSPVNVFCDMKYEGGGWTVIQRRGVKSQPKVERINFDRDWTEYENGFGNENQNEMHDYWLGLQNIHFLTQECNHELIITLTSWNGTTIFAKYTKFKIAGKEDLYRLSIFGYSGTAGDNMEYHDKMQFSTYDKDNDTHEKNCASVYKGGWWYRSCGIAKLNGQYAEDGSEGKMSTIDGIEWGGFEKATYYSYMKTEMKIRPRCAN